MNFYHQSGVGVTLGNSFKNFEMSKTRSWNNLATPKGIRSDIFDNFDNNQKEYKLKEFYVNLDKRLRLDGGPELVRLKTESNFSFKNQPRGNTGRLLKAANNITTKREGELKFQETMSKGKLKFKSIFLPMKTEILAMRNTSICLPKREPTSEVTLRESPKINRTTSLSHWGEIVKSNNKSLTSRPGKSLNLAPWGTTAGQTKDGGSFLNLYSSVADPPLASNYQDGKLVMPHGETSLKRRRNLEEVMKVNVYSPVKDNLLGKGEKMP